MKHSLESTASFNGYYMSPPLVSTEQLKMVIRQMPDTFTILDQFLDYLRYKYKTEQERKSVALWGLWADIPFDVTDQDIRRLRQQVSAQLLRKV